MAGTIWAAEHPEPITPVSRESYDGWVFNAPNYLPEGVHVTLRFLGATEPERVDGIAAGVVAVTDHRDAPLDRARDMLGLSSSARL